MATIPGWFNAEDAAVLVAIDLQQKRAGLFGDVMEIGSYLGKSAILLGYLLRPDENLLVCDVFEESVAEGLARVDQERHYRDLTKERFLANYRMFHNRDPDVVVDSSLNLRKRRDVSARFRLVHVDGAHIYDVVRHDVDTARLSLCDGGIAVFDDIRTSPAVAAAVWPFIETGMRPLFITAQKLYVTWSPVALDLDAVADALPAPTEEREIAGIRVLEIGELTAAASARRAWASPVISSGSQPTARRIRAAARAIMGRVGMPKG